MEKAAILETPAWKWAQWAGFLLGVSGSLMLALNIPISGWAYIIFTLADLCWIATALWKRIPGLVALHSAYIVVNCIGIYRWLF